MAKILLALLLFNVGCATVEKKGASADSMSIYTGKLAIVLPEKTQQVSFEYISDPKKQKARIEIRGLLGILAATIWIDEKKVHFANHLQRKFYESENTELALKTWLNRKIDPNVFFLVMEKRLLPKWQCKDEGGSPSKAEGGNLTEAEGGNFTEECINGSTRVQFFPELDGKRKVFTRTPGMDVRFVYSLPPRYRPIDNKIFVPVSPRDYQIFTQP